MNYKSYIEAFKASQEIKKQYPAKEMIVSIEPSPYGGYKIKVMPADVPCDLLLNGLLYARSKQPNQYQ